MWLPWALLLLWVPGCFALRGPSTVDGPVGGSLSVQCWYEEEHKTLNKYWCRPPRVLRCAKIVETEGPAGKMNGRVSIMDCPQNLSFTVTLENLTEEDAGTYWCGVDTPWLQDLHDPYVQVEVSVFPASTSMTPTSITAAKTSTITTVFPPVSSTSLFAMSATHSTSNWKENEEVVSSQLPLLLSLLALLLLLLMGASLLAWRMFWKRIKGELAPHTPLPHLGWSGLDHRHSFSKLCPRLTVLLSNATPRPHTLGDPTGQVPEEASLCVVVTGCGRWLPSRRHSHCQPKGGWPMKQ
uniref:CD300a molecule n=1 Tax=Macaca mulatta TaxID=9544 RepID=A0A5F7ZMX3_MACMU